MKKTLEKKIFDAVALFMSTLFAFTCLYPILLVIGGSLTKESELLKGIRVIPREFSLAAYEMVLKKPDDMLRAYGVSIALVIIGTAISIIMTSMTAYVLYRKDFPARGFFSFYFFFTTLFSGGLVPSYIWYSKLGLRNTFTILLIANVFSVMNMIITRTYITGNVPISLVESAKMDGANDFLIYRKIVMPMIKPILATTGLMTALAYWNNWSTAAIYINQNKKWPLQYYLYKLFQNQQMIELLAEAGMEVTGLEIPSFGYKLAMTVFTMGPVVLFYPFIQKYFVSGITIGAVKE